jgi:hypothetical protein
MADSAAKRMREARKRRNRETKAERKRLRKEGLLGQDNTGLFQPGEVARPVVNPDAPETPPAPEAAEDAEDAQGPKQP